MKPIEIVATIKPKHLNNILSGIKKFEVRKTLPHAGMPFKVYCCESGSHGKIKGEFTVDMFHYMEPCKMEPEMIDKCCVGIDDLENYAKGGGLYLWHISDVKIYDKPRELSEFSRFGFFGMGNSKIVCGNYGCKHFISSTDYDEPPECELEGCTIERAPQSWCYVEPEREEALKDGKN